MKFTQNRKFRALIAIPVMLLIVSGLVISVAYGQTGFFRKSEKNNPTIEPRHRVEKLKDVQVPMRDGTRLATDIFVPVTKGPFPVILARLPYGKENQKLLQIVAEGLAKRGSVFVMQDCRGRYNSQGTFTPFVDEVKDGADTVDWISRQDWFNGKLGLIGFSYLGYTAIAADIGSKIKATALLPMITTMSPYRMIYENGVLNYMTVLDWVMTLDEKMNSPAGSVDWFRPVFAPLIKVDDVVTRNIPIFDFWVKRPNPDNYWRSVDLLPRTKSVNAPALFIGGWYDIYANDVISDFDHVIRHGSINARQSRLMMGPWSHKLSRREGSIDFGNQAGFPIIAKAMVSWLETHLFGKTTSLPPRILLFVMGENRWRSEKEWPLARTRYTRYFLCSKGSANTLKGDGTISINPPVSEKPDKFTFDPKHPVTTIGGCVYPPQYAGPKDQRAVERREDVLVYTSAPLEEQLEITGPIKMILYASSSAKDTDFTAKLVAVDPGGRAINLQDGIVRARYRKSTARPSFVQPGKVTKYTIDLWATSYVFFKGQRIRVEISSSNFPRFDVNHNTGNEVATDNKYVTAQQTIYHNAQYPSHILLPVIPR